ncbi:MAG: hypothetical protein QOI54_3218 [Actinomycetota bacterium]|nr:hypothetical protein [Actinomycetota bacterium]
MDSFDWQTHPEAEALVASLVRSALAASPAGRVLAERLPAETSTGIGDWLDHVGADVDPAALSAAGFVHAPGTSPGVWRHPGAQLPAVVPGPPLLALRVDDAAAFAAAHGGAGVSGSPYAGYRSAAVHHPDEEGQPVLGVERRSWASGVLPAELDADAALRARRQWAERPRAYGLLGARDGMREARERAEAMVAEVGADLAASYVMEVERGYWMSRNTAAAVQHARQNRLGLGWGNHDHHTFRSSRGTFRELIDILRVLGFQLRERFYAGEEAGWGAQVLEHRGAGLVVFADVDLTPDEVAIDFASVELPAAPDRTDGLGTVGLWCFLHGESVLQAGMHHLEGQFDFDRLRDDLAARSIGQMTPFSDLPHLRQAFTEPERWPVTRERIDALVETGGLHPTKAAEFLARGAPGSHLENLARRGGFKGFNQANVSTTMRATDPRVLA